MLVFLLWVYCSFGILYIVFVILFKYVLSLLNYGPEEVHSGERNALAVVLL